MYKRLRPLLMISMLCCALTNLKAQHSFTFNNGPVMNKYQDSLINISNSISAAESNEDRYSKNAVFIKTLVNALKTQSSFSYPFDSLKRISILKSPDNSFRIFSWYLPDDHGGYRFFGSIQIPTKDGKLKLYPLIDHTALIKDPNQINDHKNWYGAKYYEIVPVTTGKQPYYILIGWKGNNQKTSKKVIDILSFDNDVPVFGKNVFEGAKGTPAKNRIVFEYNKLNSMTLTMDRNVNMIVFDHLAPFSPDMDGNFEFYASDLSFDAYKIVGGKLKLIQNIELKNDPNVMDDFYTDPKDKNIKAIKKL